MNKKRLTIIFTACLSFALIVFSYAFADLKAYYEDLDNDGNLETVTVHQKYLTSDNMPPFAEEGIVTVYDEDLGKADNFAMPDHMGDVEFANLNRDGFKQIIARSDGGAHYTNIAVYGYKDGVLYKIFENGSACEVKTDFKANKPTIKVGRANWGAKEKTEDGEEIDWSYASEPLWQVYRWDGKQFAYDGKLSTSPEVSEQEEVKRFVDKAKSLMEKNE